MARGKEIDWDALEVEYATGNMSYAGIAANHGIRRAAVCVKGHDREWPRKRAEYRAKTVTKAINRIGDNKSRKLERLLSAADKTAAAIDSIADAAEKCNASDIKDLTVALKNLTSVMRNLYDIPTLGETEARHIAAERLELEKKRLEADSKAPEGVKVVLTATTDKELEDWST